MCAVSAVACTVCSDVVWMQWCEVAHGPRARKKVERDYQMRYGKAQTNLEKLGGSNMSEDKIRDRVLQEMMWEYHRSAHIVKQQETIHLWHNLTQVRSL